MKYGPDDQLDEAISALIDGELDNESDREFRQKLIEKICSETALKERWTQYHLISDSLCNNLPSDIFLDLSQRVLASIENEPCYTLPDSEIVTDHRVIDAAQRFTRQASDQSGNLSRRQLLMKRVAGFAIAASVATVALVSYQIGVQQHFDENALAKNEHANSTQQQELASISPTQMATIHGVTVLASPVSTPQYNLNSDNIGNGASLSAGKFHDSNSSRYVIGYNLNGLQNGQQNNNSRYMQNSAALLTASPANVGSTRQMEDRENVMLRQYLMDHSQLYSSSRVSGAIPLARMMAVPTQSGALVSQSNQ